MNKQDPRKLVTSNLVKKGSTVGSQAVLPQTVKKSAMINPIQTWKPRGKYLDSVNRVAIPEEDAQDYAIIDMDALEPSVESLVLVARHQRISCPMAQKTGHGQLQIFNKLVKGNLVRVYLQRHSRLDHSCVALEKVKFQWVFFWDLQDEPYGTPLTSQFGLSSHTDFDVRNRVFGTKLNEESYEILKRRSPNIRLSLCSMRTYCCKKKLNCPAEDQALHEDFTGNTPTDSDMIPTTTCFIYKPFDARRRVADNNNLDSTIDVSSTPHLESKIPPQSQIISKSTAGRNQKVSQALADKFVEARQEDTASIQATTGYGCLGDLPEEKGYWKLHRVFRTREMNGVHYQEQARLVAQGYDNKKVWIMMKCIAPSKVHSYRHITEECMSKHLQVLKILAHYKTRSNRVVKALNGAASTPRAWYERLPTFLCRMDIRRGAIDKTQFIYEDRRDIIGNMYMLMISSVGSISLL
ncbi:hypothetical protein Tco_0324765 [Tanacetum coccineum]